MSVKGADPVKWFASCLWGIVLILVFGGSSQGLVDEGTAYLERSTSLKGPTGWINIPNASVAEHMTMSAGLHLGFAKINIGLFNHIEFGLQFEADRLGKQFKDYQDLSSWEAVEKNLPAFVKKAFKGNAKIKFLDQSWGLVNLSAGVEEQDYYIVAHRHFENLSKVTLLAGWGTGRFEKSFIGLNKTIFSGAELIFEYDGDGINIGYRLLLGPNLIMNLAGKELNNIGQVQNLGEVISNHLIFGITYVEELW